MGHPETPPALQLERRWSPLAAEAESLGTGQVHVRVCGRAWKELRALDVCCRNTCPRCRATKSPVDTDSEASSPVPVQLCVLCSFSVACPLRIRRRFRLRIRLRLFSDR